MSSFQQQQKKNCKAYKERGKYDPFKKETNRNYHWKQNVIADLLEKDIKTTVFMIKELRGVVEKVKEIMYQQNANVNK